MNNQRRRKMDHLRKHQQRKILLIIRLINSIDHNRQAEGIHRSIKYCFGFGEAKSVHQPREIAIELRLRNLSGESKNARQAKNFLPRFCALRLLFISVDEP